MGNTRNRTKSPTNKHRSETLREKACNAVRRFFLKYKGKKIIRDLSTQVAAPEEISAKRKWEFKQLVKEYDTPEGCGYYFKRTENRGVGVFAEKNYKAFVPLPNSMTTNDGQLIADTQGSTADKEEFRSYRTIKDSQGREVHRLLLGPGSLMNAACYNHCNVVADYWTTEKQGWKRFFIVKNIKAHEEFLMCYNNTKGVALCELMHCEKRHCEAPTQDQMNELKEKIVKY
jgi:hypothetical protein